jgi:hypothetical protein
MKIAVPDNVLRQWIQRDTDLGLPMWTDEKILMYKQQTGTIHAIEGGTGETVLQSILECVNANVFHFPVSAIFGVVVVRAPVN